MEFDVVFHIGNKYMLMARRQLSIGDACLKHAFEVIADVFGFDVRELTDDGIHVMRMSLEEFKDRFIKFLRIVPEESKFWAFVLYGAFCDCGRDWQYRALGFAPIVVKGASIARAGDPQEIMRRAMIFRAIAGEFERIRDIVYEKAKDHSEFKHYVAMIRGGK